MKNRGDCLKEYGSDYMVQQKVNAGELFKVGKGLYSEDKYVPELVVLAYRYPKAVVTMRTAFYIYGLTDVIPDKYDFSTDRNASKIQGDNIKQYFIQSNFFKQGAETAEYKGYQICVYSKERMLIELLRYKSKLPFDYYKEVLHSFRQILSTLDMQAIQDFAYEAPKSRKIMEILQNEVL